MSETVRLSLPLLSAGQAQKEVTHNEAVLAVDRLLHLAIRTRTLAAPPAAPVAGDCYIVAAAGSSVWTGRTAQIASFDGFGWTYIAPVRGMLAWIVDEAAFAVFDGVWSVGGWPVSALRIAGRQVLGAVPVNVVGPSGGITIDAESRTAINALIATLRGQGIIL